jgi:hypothetical protein
MQTREKTRKTALKSKTYSIGRKCLLSWINETLHTNFTKIDQVASGVVACQIANLIFPGQLPMNKLNVEAKYEHEYIKNYRVLQKVFHDNQVDKTVNIERLVKGKERDNLEFMQWLKCFYDSKRAVADTPSNQTLSPQGTPEASSTSRHVPVQPRRAPRPSQLPKLKRIRSHVNSDMSDNQVTTQYARRTSTVLPPIQEDSPRAAAFRALASYSYDPYGNLLPMVLNQSESQPEHTAASWTPKLVSPIQYRTSSIPSMSGSPVNVLKHGYVTMGSSPMSTKQPQSTFHLGTQNEVRSSENTQYMCELPAKEDIQKLHETLRRNIPNPYSDFRLSASYRPDPPTHVPLRYTGQIPQNELGIALPHLGGTDGRSVLPAYTDFSLRSGLPQGGERMNSFGSSMFSGLAKQDSSSNYLHNRYQNGHRTYPHQEEAEAAWKRMETEVNTMKAYEYRERELLQSIKQLDDRLAMKKCVHARQYSLGVPSVI